MLQKAIRQRRKSFEAGLLFLGTLGNNAPFVGLFGTVLGVVAAFRELGSAAGSAANGGGMGNVMGGIAEALIATAVGLAAAIPAVVMYNRFSRQLRVLTAEMETFGSEFLNIAERHFLK